MSDELTTPVMFDVAEWLQDFCELQNLPDVDLDFLDSTKDSLAIVQTSAPIKEKEYINGSSVGRLEFEILAQGLAEHKLDLKRYLTTICMLFENSRNIQISTGRIIVRASSTAPSIRDLTDNGICKFGISVALTYRE